MQPLNQQERKKAFSSFLLLYIITTLVILAGVFFGTRVPLRQNEMMQAQIARYERERIFNENFTQKTAEIQTLLDTVNTLGVQTALVEGQMDQKLTQLSALVEADSTAAKPLYKAIIKSLSERKADKAAIRAGTATATTSTEKDRIIAELKGKIQEYSTALTTCQNQLIQLSR